MRRNTGAAPRVASRWLAVLTFATLAVCVADQQAGNEASARSSEQASVQGEQPDPRATIGSVTDGPLTVELDLAQSRVEWVGTKFRGRARHEGVVRLLDASLKPCTTDSCRGRFTIDLHNLEITDMPANDTVPRRRLRDYLRSSNFFWTERYPIATFVLTETRRVLREAQLMNVQGTLTLRNVTRPIRFPAQLSYADNGALHIRAQLSIDRQQWGVRHRYDLIRNEVVDDEIQLTIILVGTATPAGDEDS